MRKRYAVNYLTLNRLLTRLYLIFYIYNKHSIASSSKILANSSYQLLNSSSLCSVTSDMATLGFIRKVSLVNFVIKRFYNLHNQIHKIEMAWLERYAGPIHLSIRFQFCVCILIQECEPAKFPFRSTACCRNPESQFSGLRQNAVLVFKSHIRCIFLKISLVYSYCYE